MFSQQAILTWNLRKFDPYTLLDCQIVVSFWENKQTRQLLLVLANFITCFPPEIPRDIAFIPSILKRVQRWRVSWIRSIGFWNRLISVSVRCIFKVSSFIHSAQSHIKTRDCSAISCTVYRTACPKRRLQGVCPRKLLPYHCLLFAVVCPTKQNRCDEVKWAGKNCTSQKELRFSCQHSNRGGQFGLVHFSEKARCFLFTVLYDFIDPFYYWMLTYYV